MKKLTVLGDGISSMLAVNYFNYHTDWEIECLTIPGMLKWNVGVSCALDTPFSLKNINYLDIEKFNANLKLGIYKKNFNNKDYFQSYELSNASIQFNSVDFTNYLKEINNITYKEVPNYDDIDTDFLFDAAGIPKLNDNYITVDSIPVNKALGIRVPHDHAPFMYTVIKAMNHGYISMIPTAKELFVTYIHNSDISTEDEILEDLSKEFPVSTYQVLPFKNYYRKIPFKGNTVYGGNKNFFIEPFEGTSLTGLNLTLREAYNLWTNNPVFNANVLRNYLDEAIDIVMMHYLSNKNKDTKFWNYANQKATEHFKTKVSKDFKDRYLNLISPQVQYKLSHFYNQRMFKENLDYLNIKDDLYNFFREWSSTIFFISILP